MRALTETDSSGVLLKLLNDARLEADQLRARLERNERILLSTRLLMGHELKRPATAIEGYLDLALELSNGTGEPEVLEAVNKARKECKLLDELSAFYLHLLKVDEKRSAGRVELVDLKKCLAETMARLPLNLEAGKRVSSAVPPEAAEFPTSPDALGVILLNLIENALRYSEGAVEVRVERSPDKRGAAAADLLKIRVADRGCGIPQESIKRVFRPFVRLHDEVTQGSGLGLTLVRSLVELQGGSVFIESAEGRGTTVHITLPEAARIDEGGISS